MEDSSSSSSLKGNSGLDIDKSIKKLQASAVERSKHRCAFYVRNALLAGGISFAEHPRDAKDYGSYLIDKGFVEVPLKSYMAVKGDIAVIQPYKGGSSAGHITMFDGKVWVSDFWQTDMWSGPGYRQHKPSYKIYRP